MHSGDTSTFDYLVWEGTMAVAETLWRKKRQVWGSNITFVLPRLAVHACRMKMHGFAVSPYSPSTASMSGIEHWCSGDVNDLTNDDDFNGLACGACPAEWSFDVLKTDDVDAYASHAVQ